MNTFHQTCHIGVGWLPGTVCRERCTHLVFLPSYLPNLWQQNSYQEEKKKPRYSEISSQAQASSRVCLVSSRDAYETERNFRKFPATARCGRCARRVHLALRIALLCSLFSSSSFLCHFLDYVKAFKQGSQR